ncbi:MAG: GNAT family N-acetyltransferase [Dehalococcoidales bacterium]
MNIQYYPNAAGFLAHVGKYLAKDGARYGLIVAIANGLVRNPHHFGPDDPWFCSIGTGTKINAVAIRTPPHNIILAHFSGDIAAIAEKLVVVVTEKFKVIPGVVGDKDLADIFARQWCDAFNLKIRNKMEQRIFRLNRVNDVPLSRGKMRPATMADKDLVVKWSHAFHVDTGMEKMGEPEMDITPLLEMGWIFLWEDGKPVAMARQAGVADKGITVSGVYTPPELRGKGYATSCVAELSKLILQSGKEFCMLYTDLAIPTSNSIYKKIGYKEVADSVEYTFKV